MPMRTFVFYNILKPKMPMRTFVFYNILKPYNDVSCDHGDTRIYSILPVAKKIG